MSAVEAASTTAVDQRLLQRGDTVLWTLAGRGVILHNFACHRFLELDAVGRRTWAFLDGARTVDEVVSRVCAGEPRPGAERRVRALVDILVEYGFVRRRSDDA
jgi:hypothetical protein